MALATRAVSGQPQKPRCPAVLSTPHRRGALVTAGLLVAKLISPRSINKQKAEPYECGLPTRGRSWVQFNVGYYLFAILFLMFDIETVFLFPWATVVEEIGVYALVSISFFLVVLILGLAYAWKKGALKWE